MKMVIVFLGVFFLGLIGLTAHSAYLAGKPLSAYQEQAKVYQKTIRSGSTYVSRHRSYGLGTHGGK